MKIFVFCMKFHLSLVHIGLIYKFEIVIINLGIGFELNRS